MGMVIDHDKAAPISRQAMGSPVGESAVEPGQGMPSADRALDLDAVQQAQFAPPLGVLRPDEVFDHCAIKLRRAWDGIRRDGLSTPMRQKSVRK